MPYGCGVITRSGERSEGLRRFPARACRSSLQSTAVAADKITLEVQSRDRIGTRDVKRLRRTGAIPGVVYGGGSEPRSIVVQSSVLRAALTGDQGRNAILHVSIDGGPTVPSILKAWQMDPIKDKLRHFDLQEIALDKAIVANVSVALQGESPGAKIGGALNQTVHQVRIQALPNEMPNQLQIDISGLQVGGSLRVSEIVIPKGATLLDDSDTIVVAVAATRRTAGIAPATPAAPAAPAAAAPVEEPAVEAEPDADAADAE